MPKRPTIRSPAGESRLVRGQDNPSVAGDIPAESLVAVVLLIGVRAIRRGRSHANDKFDGHFFAVQLVLVVLPHRGKIVALPQLNQRAGNSLVVQRNLQAPVQVQRVIPCYSPPKVLHERRTFEGTYGATRKAIDNDLHAVLGQGFILDDVEIPRWLVVRQPRRHGDGDREGQSLSLIHGCRSYFDIRAELENSALHPDAIDTDAVIIVLLGGAPAETESVIDGIVERHAAAIVENAEALGRNGYGYRIFRQIRLLDRK